MLLNCDTPTQYPQGNGIVMELDLHIILICLSDSKDCSDTEHLREQSIGGGNINYNVTVTMTRSYTCSSTNI